MLDFEEWVGGWQEKTKEERNCVQTEGHHVWGYQCVKWLGTLGEWWKRFVLWEKQWDNPDSISMQSIEEKKGSNWEGKEVI